MDEVLELKHGFPMTFIDQTVSEEIAHTASHPSNSHCNNNDQVSMVSLSGLGNLSRWTMINLMSYFKGKTNHVPSPRMLEALKALAINLEQQANGVCAPYYHLSSLDPGIGKTSLIVEFIRVLMKANDCDHVSVLLCVSRLEEIKKLVRKMDLKEADFAVFTAKGNVVNDLGLGKEKANEARVLFTTQAMFERRSINKQVFKDLQEFHYRGRPRMVRVWDEAILPGVPLTLSMDDVTSLIKPINRAGMKELASSLVELFCQIMDAKDKEVIQMPDLKGNLGVDLPGLLAVLNDTSGLKEAATVLYRLSGKTATVRYDGQNVNTVLDYHDTLPDDFAPVLVLDASGRVRETYALWSKYRKNLRPLGGAAKSYRNLTVHHWQQGGGKSAFRDPRQHCQLIDGIVATINSKPDEDWLVVHHKKERRFDVEQAILDSVEGNRSRISFVTWGNHNAANDYVHIKNVILAGTLFYPVSRNEAQTRMVTAKPSGSAIKDDLIDTLILGEHKDLILQAACRGAVRQSRGDDCTPCDVFIIAAKRHRIGEALGTIFPHCRVKPWSPVKKGLRGKTKEAFRFIELHLSEHPDDLLPVHVVVEAIGYSRAKAFNDQISKREDFGAALKAAGVVLTGVGRSRGFMTVAASYGFTEEAT